MNEKTTPHAPGSMGAVVDGKTKTAPVTQPIKPTMPHVAGQPAPSAAPTTKI